MKKLYHSGQVFEAERIVKTADSIIGYDGDAKVFAFRGIKDWSLFHLEHGQDWDVDEKVAEATFLLDLDFRVSLLELGVV